MRAIMWLSVIQLSSESRSRQLPRDAEQQPEIVRETRRRLVQDRPA